MWLWVSVVKRQAKQVTRLSSTPTTIMPILLVTYTLTLKKPFLKSVIKLPFQECTNMPINASAPECSRRLESITLGKVNLLHVLAAYGNLSQLMDNVLVTKELAMALAAHIDWLRLLKQSKPVACTDYLTKRPRPTTLTVSLPVLSLTTPLRLAISNASMMSIKKLPMSNKLLLGLMLSLEVVLTLSLLLIWNKSKLKQWVNVSAASVNFPMQVLCISWKTNDLNYYSI